MIRTRDDSKWSRGGLRILWWIAPFFGFHTLPLSIPAQRTQEWLIKYLNGEWSFEAGRQDGILGIMGYRYSHEYTGVVNGNSFKLTGPFSRDGIPMRISGELQPQGQVSSLYLHMQVSLSNLVANMWRPIMMTVICAYAATAMFHGWELGSLHVSWIGVEIPWMVIFILGMWSVATYISMVIWIHHQTHHLFKHLILWANKFE